MAKSKNAPRQLLLGDGDLVAFAGLIQAFDNKLAGRPHFEDRAQSKEREFRMRDSGDRLRNFAAERRGIDRDGVGTVAGSRGRGDPGQRARYSVHGLCPRCALPAPPPSTVFARDSTPGVYTHATAVNNLIRGDAVIGLNTIGRGAIAFAFAAIIAAATLTLPLLAAVRAYLAAAALWTFGAVLAFTYSSLALPLIEPLLAGVVSLGATTGFRFLVADKDRRFLRKSFGLYLAPSVIEKMVNANTPPALGGEMRNVTIFFSDLAGFSSISEALAPPELVRFMNEYLSAMTDIIRSRAASSTNISATRSSPAMRSTPRCAAATVCTSSTASRPNGSALPCISASGLIPTRRWSAISVRTSVSTIRLWATP